MIYLLGLAALLLLAYGPSLWVRYVINKHSKTIDAMPGTGAELAEHFIERYKLEGVTVKRAEPEQNYYSPEEKLVGLSPDVYDGKSISAVAIATHEIGHAIQYHRQEPVSRLRSRYTKLAVAAQRLGIFVMTAAPLLTLITKAPPLTVLMLLAGVVAMLGSVALYAMILPEEFDASFAKALPILEEGYLPAAHLPAARQVLKAAALTYVAGALASIFSIWRWLRVLR